MSRLVRGVGLSMALLLARPLPALAWGDEGHEAVALVADHYLTPAARAALAALLGPSDPNLAADIASRATWADKYRESSPQRRKATQNWHFVDLEITGPNLADKCFGHLRQAPAGRASASWSDDCVVDKIEQFRVELSDPATPADERPLALQFLLHFVGDVHQPLHSSDNNDRGGNEVYVVFRNRRNPVPLHSFWDDEAVSYTANKPDAYATTALAALTPDACRGYAAGADQANAAEGWAMDAFGEAKAVAYGELPTAYVGTGTVHTRSGSQTVQYYALSDAYVGHAQTLAQAQISAAGVRLAVILNRVLANAGTDCG